MRNVIDEKRVRKWEATAGACCFIGGILAALMGSLLTAGEWIVGAPLHRWIHIAGTTLFIITIPLILFAGFCLDWAEREPKKSLPRDPQEAHRQAQRGAAALAQIALIAVIAGAALLTPGVLQAQQTIFNVPGTKVLDCGKVYGELDLPFKPNDRAVEPVHR